MKKKILIVISIILLSIVLILIMSNNTFAKETSKIEITVPEPTIGKTLAKASEITVKANNNEKFEVFEVTWCKGKYNAERKLPSDTKAKLGEEYSVMLHYKRPNTYELTSSTQITVNGIKIDIDDINDFNHYGGDDWYDYDCVIYESYMARKTNLSKIEITIPEPTIGKTLAKPSEITVKANNNEKFEVFEVTWCKGKYKAEGKLPSDTKAKLGETYSIMLHYKRPNKYGLTSSTQITVNGIKINIDDINDFNHYGGDDWYDYDCVIYEGFGAIKDTLKNENTNKQTTSQEKNKTDNKQTTSKTPTKQTTNKEATSKTSTKQNTTKEELEQNDNEIKNEIKTENIMKNETNLVELQNEKNTVEETLKSEVEEVKKNKKVTIYIVISIIIIIAAITTVFFIKKEKI